MYTYIYIHYIALCVHTRTHTYLGHYLNNNILEALNT